MFKKYITIWTAIEKNSKPSEISMQYKKDEDGGGETKNTRVSEKKPLKKMKEESKGEMNELQEQMNQNLRAA